MPDHRKPPLIKPTRPEVAPMPSSSDSGGFSIESTTMRLKSLRLRRAEADEREFKELERDRQPSAKTESSRARDDGPAGRVRHDERGVAVWDWAVATGEFAALSQTAAVKKLALDDLKIAETARTPVLNLQAAGRDKGGGFDPYNQRGSGRREGEAAKRQGITGAADRDRNAVLDQLLGKKK